MGVPGIVPGEMFSGHSYTYIYIRPILSVELHALSIAGRPVRYSLLNCSAFNMKRQALRRTQNSLASTDTQDIESLATASSSTSTTAVNIDAAPSLSVVEPSLSTSSVTQPIVSPALPATVELSHPQLASWSSSSLPSSVHATISSQTPLTAAAGTSTSHLFGPLPYIPPVPWPSQPLGGPPTVPALSMPTPVHLPSPSLPSFSSAPSLSLPSRPPYWPPSLPSTLASSQPSAVGSTPLLATIAQPVQGALEQFVAMANAHQQTQQRAVALEQENQARRAQIQ